MFSPRLLQLLLFLGVCVEMTFSTIFSSGEYVLETYPGRSSGKGKGKGSTGRDDFNDSWNKDPDEDNVESPPVAPFTEEPSAAPSGKPSQSPSALPTCSTPSFSPTASPSAAPSPIPSDTPTVSKSPTTNPSSLPTVSAAPSFSHAPTISAAPSQSQAPSTSPAPSVSSSPTTTYAPSISFSPTTSLSPTIAKCTTNADGFFGDASPNEVVVSFGYELEYKAGNDESEVISNLENSFNDFLLPFLFPSACPSDDTVRMLASFRARRRLETIGVSKRPDDVPLTGVTCAQKADEANECIVLDAGLTVYTTSDGTLTQNEDEIRDQLKQGMKNGDFVQDPVARVSYVDVESDPDPNKNDGGTDPVTQAGGGRNRVVFGVVAAVASLLLIALAVVWRRKQLQQQNEESVMTGSDEAATDIGVDDDV